MYYILVATPIIAHRGHSAGAPENTRAAFAEAVRHGAVIIEADIRLTSDGALVVLHDATVDRTTSGSGPVAALDARAVAALDAGSWFAADFAGERVPVLADLFAFAVDAGVGLCLEAKGETPAETWLVAAAVAAEIARRGRLAVDYLSSFDHAALGRAAAATPGLRTAPDRLPERGTCPPGELLRQARESRAAVLQHHHADLTADIVAALRGAGVEVWAWPANTEAEVRDSLALGVDGVMTDDVRVTAAALGRRG